MIVDKRTATLDYSARLLDATARRANAAGVVLVGVMARAPVPGETKTRLGATFGPVWAAGLAEAMMRDTLSRLAASRARNSVSDGGVGPSATIVFAAPSPTCDACDVLARGTGCPVVAQQGVDLGARIVHAFAELFCRGATRALLMGTDAPLFPRESLAVASACGDDVVLGPSDDGGYWLVGLRRPEPRLFDAIPWSTSSVLEATRSRCEALRLSCTTLATTRDIDEPEDVAWLASALVEDPRAAPSTADYLARYFARSGP